jgi:hypothetical protein
MYQHSLLQEQLRVDRQRELDRSFAVQHRIQPGRAPKARRSWWPRPRRNALRLAFAGLTPSRAGRKTACADC